MQVTSEVSADLISGLYLASQFGWWEGELLQVDSVGGLFDRWHGSSNIKSFLDPKCFLNSVSLSKDDRWPVP